MKLASTVSLDEVARHRWQVAVVGAGPAGAVVARELARLNASVLLIDKSSFPRWKVCGCCLNLRALSALQSVGLGELVARHGAIPLTEMRFASRRRCARIPLPGGAALSRQTLDAALVQEAINAGAAFLASTRASLGDLHAERRELILNQRGRQAIAAAQLVLAADGLGGSLLTGQSGFEASARKGSRIGAGAIADGPPGLYGDGAIFMASGKGGYVGLVRLEDGRLDIAAALNPVAVKQAGGMGAAAEAVLHEAGMPPVPGLGSLPWRGTPALTRRVSRLAVQRALVVGDAAGYVEPFTGEGMAWAISAAIALAPLAYQAAAHWDSNIATQWDRLYRRTVARRQIVCRLTSSILKRPSLTSALVRVLCYSPMLATAMVRAINAPYSKDSL